jgi:hypothetical protein
VRVVVSICQVGLGCQDALSVPIPISAMLALQHWLVTFVCMLSYRDYHRNFTMLGYELSPCAIVGGGRLRFLWS